MREITIELDDESFSIAEVVAAKRGVSVEEVIRDILIKLPTDYLPNRDSGSETEPNSEG